MPSTTYAIICASCLLAACDAKPRQSFAKAMFYTFSHDGPSIILGFVSQDGSHLSGTFTFENISGEREQAKDVVLHGVRRPGGFWASVRCEARRDDHSAWESLGKSWVVGWPAKLTVKADSKAVDFSVRLDVFEGLLGKYRFGRVVLSSGDKSEFLLEDLTAPQTQQSSNPYVGSQAPM